MKKYYPIAANIIAHIRNALLGMLARVFVILVFCLMNNRDEVTGAHVSIFWRRVLNTG